MLPEIFSVLSEKRKIFVLSLAVVGIAAAFLMNFLSLPGLLQGQLLFSETAEPGNFAFLVVFSVLSAIAISLHASKMQKSAKTNIGFAGMFAGIFTSACSVCSPLLLTALGIPTAIAILPFGGVEVYAISILLLLLAIYFSAKPMTCKAKT